MLSGPALLRVLLLIAVAGAVIALTRPFWSGAVAPPDQPIVAALPSPSSAPARRAESPATARTAEPVARTIASVPGTLSGEGDAGSSPEPEVRVSESAAKQKLGAASDCKAIGCGPKPVPPAAPDTRRAAVETQSLFGTPPTAREESSPAVAAVPAPAPKRLAAAEPEIAIMDGRAQPREVDLIDLNSGSLAELNGLRGAGSVGRAIIQHRPYSTVDQLLSKRVLSRLLFQRVKDQVTIR